MVWQDEAGQTFNSANDPEWLAQRHGAGSALAVAAMAAAALAVTDEAVARKPTFTAGMPQGVVLLVFFRLNTKFPDREVSHDIST